MDYTTELNRINDKYYNKIKKEYSKYIKNFDSIPDLTQNVYIIPDDKCIDDYKDLAVGKNRGRCDADTGNIYIRESAFCDHLLIHEFIHRLSRNKTKKILFPQKILGIATEAKYIGINEIFTEYLSIKIDTEECNSYLQFINIFSTLDETSIIDFTGYYFKGDIFNFINLLISIYGEYAKEIIENTSIIISS